MAFKKKGNIFFIILLIVTEITLPLVATQNIDCKGKAFHCVNSTHFKICVDLGGGVSTTVDDFLIPCPKSTVCKNSNYFECEYHPTTTLKPTQLSEVTNEQNSETPAVENFDFLSTLNGSLMSDIELSKVIISTTPIPKVSSTTFTIDSDIDPKNVTSVISDSATYSDINIAITEVSSNNLLSTTSEKVILDNNELNYTEPVNYASEKVHSTDNNLTGATLNTYLASDVIEGYTKSYIENKSTLLSNTFTNYNDKDDYNHTSVKNESFLVISPENITVFKKTTNIKYGVTAIETEPNSSITKNIEKESSTETVLRSSLHDKVAEQNTITSSQNILSTFSEDQFNPLKPFQNEVSITTNGNINIQNPQEELFTATQSDIWKENNTTESNLLALHEKGIISNTEKETKTTTYMSKYEPSSTLSPIIQYLSTVKNILYHQNEYMPTKKDTQGSFNKERVITDINDAYIDNLSTFNYESTTESNSNYNTGRIREEPNVSTQNVSDTFNYSLSNLQLSTYTASNEDTSFTGNPLQSTINGEIKNVYSLPNTISKPETVIEILNDGSKPIYYYNYTSKHDQTIILTQTESVSKKDGTKTIETTRDNLRTTTTMSPTEFSNQTNSVLNSLLPTMYKNPKEFVGDTFIELQATEDFYSRQSDENPHQLTSTISVTKNKIPTLPLNITLSDNNISSKFNSTTDATTKYDKDINKYIKTKFVNARNINISAVIDKQVANFTTIINVSDAETTASFMTSEGEKTNAETHMYDSEKIPTTVTLIAGKYPTSTDSIITSNIEILNNIKFKDMTLTADTTEPYGSTIDASLRILKNTKVKDPEDTNISKSNKINTIITKDMHAVHITVPNITIPEGNDVSMEIYNNINNQEKVDMSFNKTNDINLLKRSKMNPEEEVTEIYKKIAQSSPKSIETQKTTTIKLVDANINKNNKKNILIFNDTDTTSEEYISNEKLEYSNNIHTSNKINMQIFNSTNYIDAKYVTNKTGLVVNDSISNLNMDSPITENKITDLNLQINLEKIYKAPNNVKLNGNEISIDIASSAVNSSQANITQIYHINDDSQVNYKDNVIQTTDSNIPTYDTFKVKHDKSKANTMNVNYINGIGIKMQAHKNNLLNKGQITKANISSTEASVNSLTTKIYYYNKTKDGTSIDNDTANDGNIVDINDINKTLPHMVYDISLNRSVDTNVQQKDTVWEKQLVKTANITDSNNMKTLLMNNTEIDQSPDVNITIDNEDNIQKNNSINEFNLLKKSTVSDVITESVKIAILNSNIDELKEIKPIAGTAIHDLNFNEGNNNRQTNNNTLAIQSNIEDHIKLEKNHTKNVDNKQMPYNIETYKTKYNKFELDRTTDNASVTKTLSTSITDLNLEIYSNSDVNVIKDKEVDMNFANSTDKGIPKVNATEPKEIKLIIDNINATAIDNINMPMYNNIDDSQIKIKIVHDLSNNNGVNISTHAVTKTDVEKRFDITMDNLPIFNTTLANENIAVSDDEHIKVHNDTLIESSKSISEHTMLGFNVTKSNAVNLNISAPVDLFNIKSSATSQQIYNNTKMQEMISVSDLRVLNKSDGNTNENNIIKVKGINIYSTPKDTSNHTYPKDIKNEDIKLEKRRSNQTSTTNNNSKIPDVSKLEVSTSFYSVIAKEINTNFSEISQNKPNLPNLLDILNSNKSFESVTLTNSEIHLNPEITSDATFINEFTVPSGSIISNLNYSMESTLENPLTKRTPLSKLEFKNGYETLNTNNNNKSLNKTVSKINDDVSNINRILKTNTSTPSSKIELIKIIENVKDIKFNEEVSGDSKYLEIAPNNEKKQSMITNTERSAISQSTYFVQHVNKSSTTTFNCTVGSRGKYSDKNDCNKFYICIGKLTPIIGRCPSDTVFSEINKQCTNNLSHCIRNNQFKCLAEGRFIDLLSNNSYFICAKNPSKGLVRFKLKCQEGYRLNTDTVHCTLKPWSIEDDSKNTSQKSTKEKISSESDKSKRSFDCEKEGLFEFPDDSRKYFHCAKKSKSEFRRKIKKCDSDEVFEKDKQKCVDEDSHEEVNDDESNIDRILKTNTSTPSSKIEPIEIIDYVKNIKVKEETSEDIKYLEMGSNNEKKQSIIRNTEKSALSKPTYFVQHINISTPTPFSCNEGIRGKYSDENDCNKFYICIGKLTPIIRRCPSDTVFSEINKQCTKNLSHCIRNNQFKCLAEGRFIDVLSTNFYYICAKNQLKGLVRFKLKCQEGYSLNTDTVHCTLKPRSIEDDSKNTSEKSTKEKLSSESDKSKKSFDCEKEGLFEFPDD